MVQYDGQVWHRLGEIGQLEQLRVVQPTFQGQPHTYQNPGAGPEIVTGQLPLHLVRGGVFQLRVRVPSNRVADTAESVGAGRLQCLQHRLDPVPQVQVGVADNGCRSPARAIKAAGAGGGQTLNELDLANGAHFLGSIGSVHCPCLDEHGGSHVVPAVDVVGQLV